MCLLLSFLLLFLHPLGAAGYGPNQAAESNGFRRLHFVRHFEHDLHLLRLAEPPSSTRLLHHLCGPSEVSEHNPPAAPVYCTTFVGEAR